MGVDGQKFVYIVDDDALIRQATHVWLTASHYQPRSFAGAVDFIEALPTLNPGCVLLDIRMPEIDGLGMLERYAAQLGPFAVIVMTGFGDVATAVQAMKLGAVDFLEKPFTRAVVVAQLELAFSKLSGILETEEHRQKASDLVARLTARERDVLNGLLAGRANKVLAFELGVSPRTVEMHRANMMKKLGVASLSDALKIALAANMDAER